MKTELIAVFEDFEVGDADDAMTKKKSLYPKSNESKFNFWSFVVTFTRGDLHHGHFTLLKRFLRVCATFERSYVRIRVARVKWIFVAQCFLAWSETHLVSVLCKIKKKLSTQTLLAFESLLTFMN